jgi:hypothetical protein
MDLRTVRELCLHRLFDHTTDHITRCVLIDGEQEMRLSGQMGKSAGV